MASVVSPMTNNHSAERQSFFVAVACSLAIHAILLWLVVDGAGSARLKSLPPPLMVSMVSLQQPPPRKDAPKQIISEPLSPSAPPLKETNRLAEHDHRAEREQIARGVGTDPAVQPAKVRSPIAPAPKAINTVRRESGRSKNEGEKGQSPASHTGDRAATRAPEPSRRVAAPSSLRLDADAALSRFGNGRSERVSSQGAKGRGAAAAESASSRLDAALSAPAGVGSADKVPGLQEGSFTLLNAKADRYAVFVRRVAYRVFTTLRGLGWTSLAAGHVRAIQQPVVVIAELSPQGTFISASIRLSSGSPRFDALVSAAVRQSVSDPNPPSGAVAADGRIRFIFQSTSKVLIGPSGPQGFPSERRSLELGTGLD